MVHIFRDCVGFWLTAMELAQSPMRMAAGSSAVRESLVLFAKPLPRVVDPESDDANGDEAGRAAEESDVGGNALHLADDLVLLVFFVGVGRADLLRIE
jgi:hypothetical protein